MLVPFYLFIASLHSKQASLESSGAGSGVTGGLLASMHVVSVRGLIGMTTSFGVKDVIS